MCICDVLRQFPIDLRSTCHKELCSIMASTADRILTFTPEFQQQAALFIRELYAPEDDALRTVRQNIIDQGLPVINIRAEEGHMLLFLAQLCGARRILEIGTLAGYSGIWLARALPEGGSLITLEMDPRHAQIAREHFALAGVADRVQLIEGEALHTLTTTLANADLFDMVFIDADKDSYPDYYEWAVTHTRPGGLITAHNAFRSGQLFDDDPKANPTRVMLKQMGADPRVTSTIVPVGDGFAAAVVK
jgi:caffeoyl-CoA O-methyltransferase